MMRTIVVHPRMSVQGGGERVAIHSLKAALRAGHTACLLSEDFDIAQVEEFFACEGLFSRVERLTYPVFSPRLVRGLHLYQQLFYHRRQIHRLLSTHLDFQLVLSTQDIGYAPSSESPVLQYCYFPDYFSHIEGEGSSPWWKLYYWPARLYYHQRVKHVDKFLSTSEYTRHFVRRVWDRDSTTLYPPCPVDLYKSSPCVKENVVVTVARLVPEKRIENFLEIAGNLPALKFVVIGRVQSGWGGYYETLRRIAPANTSFIDAPLRKARNVLAGAKVYVHCARNEQFGIAIVEAMAARCVPVVHDSGGPREIVTQDVGYRWQNTREASQKISTLMEDDELRERLSRSSASRAELFSNDVFESSLAATLKEYGA